MDNAFTLCEASPYSRIVKEASLYRSVFDIRAAVDETFGGTLSIVSISLKREAKSKSNYSFFLYTTYSGHLVPAARSAYILTVKNTYQSSTPIAGGL